MHIISNKPLTCDEFEYVAGTLEPHYPMPAIRYEIVHICGSLYMDDVHKVDHDLPDYCVYAYHTIHS